MKYYTKASGKGENVSFRNIYVKEKLCSENIRETQRNESASIFADSHARFVKWLQEHLRNGTVA